MKGIKIHQGRNGEPHLLVDKSKEGQFEAGFLVFVLLKYQQEYYRGTLNCLIGKA